jgi:hypothetical protein
MGVGITDQKERMARAVYLVKSILNFIFKERN